jgi:shikimate kinase / 3-dehydroquinate synthase
VTRPAPGAIGRHIVLVGFMGAGKTTIGREVARLTERPFVDLDEEIERRHGPIARIFDERGEPEFRRLEERLAAEVLAAPAPAVVSLGGGAVESERTSELLRRQAAFRVDVAVDDAWERVRASDRPLARDEAAFRALHARRLPLYEAVGPAVADPDDLLLRALGVQVGRGLREQAAASTTGTAAVVADERVLTLHEPPVAAPLHAVPQGEPAKQLAVAERLWRELKLDRGGTVVAFGGGTTTDLAGFVAATFLRGVGWIAVPTTLVGQVDAAIGGKTAIDLPGGKNLVGAFHFPDRVLVDPDFLATLPERERRQGMAEVVKTGLLAGRPLWELPEDEMVRACAAFKCAVVLSDPYEEGRRAILNLGHTFGHALEAASDYTLTHGDAVALGLLAALRLSGQPTDVVEELLKPEPVRVDHDRAWSALKRDKKAAGGRTRLVLLPKPGEPDYGVELPDADVREALDRLIAP